MRLYYAAVVTNKIECRSSIRVRGPNSKSSTPLSGLEKLIQRDLEKLRKKAVKGIKRASRDAVSVVASHVPVAFGELIHSIHPIETGAKEGHVASTVTSAPHAAAVEVGSRPHLVPLDDLIAWVKLRGAQGLTKTGRIRSSRWKPKYGTTTKEHATRVARQLKAMQSGGALDVAAPEKIARAIQMAILKAGTKPHWYTAKSLPEIEKLLSDEMLKVWG